MKALLLRAHGELDLIKRENRKISKLLDQKSAEISEIESEV
jgi:hypothetical protein